MSEEKQAGVIPRLIVRNALVTREYSVLVTDKRSIFILQTPRNRGEPGTLASSLRRAPDYERVDPELLATDPKNFVIPHQYLEKIELKKGSRGSHYRFNIEYRTPEGKGKKVVCRLILPGESLGQPERDVASERGTEYEYAKRVQELYVRALPPIATEAFAEWDL